MENVTALVVSARELDIRKLTDEDDWYEVEGFVDEEIKRLSDQMDGLERRLSALRDIKLDDPRMKRRLRSENSPVTVEMIQAIWLEVTKPEREAKEREWALVQKTWNKSSSLRYFVITNARKSAIHILADDAAVARYIAWQASRIASRNNGNIRPYDTVSIEKLPYGKGIEEALLAGWPGEIEIMGTKVIHRQRKEVFG